MIKNICVLIVFVVIIIVILAVIMQKNKECFTIPAKQLNVAMIFACYNFDLIDFNFVKKYHKDIKCYVVISGKGNQYTDRLKQFSDVILIFRKNVGWDTTAWKDTIMQHYQHLCGYDMILLVNNSCRYDFDLLKLCQQAMFYDMYGLVRSREITEHLQSYFICIHNHLFKTKDFQNYWLKQPEITNRSDAIKYHELAFMKYFNDLGYKIGHYDNTGINVYGIDMVDSTRNYYPEFVKKKVLNPVYTIEDYEKYLSRNFKF